MWKKLKEWLMQNKQIEDDRTEAHHSTRPKFGIVVGHTKLAPGANLAKPYGQSEYEYHTELATLCKWIAQKNNLPFDVEVFYRDQGGIAGAYSRASAAKCDAVVELHFNAYNGVARGTETLCSASRSDQEFAMFFQKETCALFDRSGLSRGVKVLSRQDRGGTSVYSFPLGCNCLVEPVFGDNAVEAKMYVEKKQEYANCLLVAFHKWAVESKLLQ